MTRPTTEELYVALAEIRGTREHAVIEAELRALRQQLRQAERRAAEAPNVALLAREEALGATLARVQALPGKWRDIAQRVRRRVLDDDAFEAVLVCTQDLEEALRGPDR